MARAIPQTEAILTMHRVTGGDPLLFETRENVLDAYRQLRDSHPAFPEVLRDFQVIKSTTNSTACTLLPLQADIVAAAINAEDGHHILSSLPTRGGTRLPSERDYLQKNSSLWRLSINNRHKLEYSAVDFAADCHL